MEIIKNFDLQRPGFKALCPQGHLSSPNPVPSILGKGLCTHASIPARDQSTMLDAPHHSALNPPSSLLPGPGESASFILVCRTSPPLGPLPPPAIVHSLLALGYSLSTGSLSSPLTATPRFILQTALRVSFPKHTPDRTLSHLEVPLCLPVSCRTTARPLSSASPLLHTWSHT